MPLPGSTPRNHRITAMCQHIDAWHAAGALQGKDPVNSWRADISPTA